MNKLLASLLILTIICCAENISDDIAVLQEDIVYLSSERLVLTGRIVALGEVDASDHGFVISTNEQLSNPRLIDLGPQNIPGRFVGGINDLEVNKRYWAAAFADIAGTRLLSDKISFSTLKPNLTAFSPLIGATNETVTITGSNFTNDISVKFGDQEAEIIEIIAESIIRVRIPPSNKEVFATISVESQGVIETFEKSFEYVFGKWEMVSTFPENSNMYRWNFWTESSDYALFGLGDIAFNMNLNNEVFLYSKMEDQWASIQYEGQPLIEAFAAWPYFGSGATNRDVLVGSSKDLYKVENGIISKRKDMPIGLYKSVAFSFDQSLYVFGGIDSTNSENRKILEYNINQDSWQFLEGRQFVANSDYPSFQYNNEGYFLGKDNLLVKFNPASKTFTTISEFPSTVNVENIVQVIGSKVYIGVSKNRKDLWELDLESLVWKRKEPFGGDFRSTITSSWLKNNALYTLRHNIFAGQQPMEIWRFSPQEFQ